MRTPMIAGKWKLHKTLDEATALVSELIPAVAGNNQVEIVVAPVFTALHKVAEAIEAAIDVPFIHLADTTADAVLAAGLDSVGLLGTRFTMEEDFYRDRLESRGLTVLTPSEAERTLVHDVIFDELVRGELNRSSREDFLDVIDRLGSAGAQGVIAGCTEIELLVTEDDVFVPWFPTTRLHAAAAVEAALD